MHACKHAMNTKETTDTRRNEHNLSTAKGSLIVGMERSTTDIPIQRTCPAPRAGSSLPSPGGPTKQRVPGERFRASGTMAAWTGDPTRVMVDGAVWNTSSSNIEAILKNLKKKRSLNRARTALHLRQPSVTLSNDAFET